MTWDKMIWRKGCRANQSGLKMHNGLTWSFANSFCMLSFGELDMLAVNDLKAQIRDLLC